MQNAKIQEHKKLTKVWDSGIKDPETGKDIVLLYKDAASWITDEVLLCLYVFNQWKLLGLMPFSGGYAEQPFWISHALSVLQEEQQLWENKKTEEAMHKHD